MKTYKNIYPQICTYQNLSHAWRKAAKGKRQAPEVADFEYFLTDNLLQLETELQNQTCRPRPYRHFRITVRQLQQQYRVSSCRCPSLSCVIGL